MPRGRRAWIRAEAWRALLLSGAQRPDQIDPIRTAKALGMDIAYGGITGASERISMIGGRALIRISDEIVRPGRRAFTTSHAIGHMICGHTIRTGGDVEGWIRDACGDRTKLDERESDMFATEHLTPERWARPYCTVARADLDAVHAIASAFPVSPMMAAMRFVELTPLACAVVYAEDGRVKWCKGNRAFPGRVMHGGALPEGSLARAHFEGGRLSEKEQAAPARAWLPLNDRITDRSEIVEHAMAIPEPGWNGTLSLLWMLEPPTGVTALAA